MMRSLKVNCLNYLYKVQRAVKRSTKKKYGVIDVPKSSFNTNIMYMYTPGPGCIKILKIM